VFDRVTAETVTRFFTAGSRRWIGCFPFTIVYSNQSGPDRDPGACAHEPAAGLRFASALTCVHL
jgi:hypothetical protein